MGSKQKSLKRHLPFLIIAAILFVAVAGGSLLYRSAQRQPAPNSNTSAGSAQPKVLPGAQPPHARGAEGAPVTLEEYGDFECPPCGAFYPALKRIEAEYGPEKLRVVFRQFPLVKIHKQALLAAYAAEAAGLQGKFWEMYDKLYSDQATWTKSPDARPLFVNYARDIGLDVNQFMSDADGPQVQSRIMADFQRGKSLGVVGTPTIFVNGRQLPATATEKDIHDAINAGLGVKGE
jgi:protein-disulfide isomerase